MLETGHKNGYLITQIVELQVNFYNLYYPGLPKKAPGFMFKSGA